MRSVRAYGDTLRQLRVMDSLRRAGRAASLKEGGGGIGLRLPL
jgi:hypothetical protein